MSTQTSLLKRFLAALSLSVLCFVTGGPLLASPTSVQSLAQSYTSQTTLQTGQIVIPSNKADTQVSAATYGSAAKIIGVTVAATAVPVTLTQATPATNAGQQVYVASSGRYEVLVSNQGGVINVGDYIAVSSLNGVGMKADGEQGEVLGRAAGAFDGQHNVASTTSLRDQSGRNVTVTITRIPVDIAIGVNPLANKDGGYVPHFLQKTVDVVTSKPVSAWQIYSALIILAIALITGTSLLYGGTRSSMIAIGRNPLARKSIMRNLGQVIITTVIIIVLGIFGSYVILKV